MKDYVVEAPDETKIKQNIIADGKIPSFSFVEQATTALVEEVNAHDKVTGFMFASQNAVLAEDVKNKLKNLKLLITSAWFAKRYYGCVRPDIRIGSKSPPM